MDHVLLLPSNLAIRNVCFSSGIWWAFHLWKCTLKFDHVALFTSVTRRLGVPCQEETQCFYESCFQIYFVPLPVIKLLSLIVLCLIVGHPGAFGKEESWEFFTNNYLTKIGESPRISNQKENFKMENFPKQTDRQALTSISFKRVDPWSRVPRLESWLHFYWLCDLDE